MGCPRFGGSPFFFGYRTSSGGFAGRLSDSLRLSDKLGRFRWTVVRFFAVIGQARANSLAVVRFFAVIGQVRAVSLDGCPILCGYRTSSGGFAGRLSDSLWLSDKFGRFRWTVVRFFADIGQAQAVSFACCPILRGYRTSSGKFASGCPILGGYRTSSGGFAGRLSDFSRLSDKFGQIRLPVVRFFSVIGQVRADSLAGCPILGGYRTSSGGFAGRLSDFSRLSDKFGQIRLLFLRQ
jgi:hypothetical protein